jgi:diacylglycerol kinase (ATP)
VVCRVDVVVNRLARHLVDERGLLLHVRRASTEAGAELHETRSLEELETVARRIRERGSDCVVLAGGDGSYMAGVTALGRAFGATVPRVAFVPGGTAGTVLRNWGYRGSRSSPGQYTRRVIVAAARGTARVTPRPTLRVKDDAGRDAVGFIFGAGLVANFFDAYYANPRQGYAAAAAIVARVFVGSPFRGAFARRVLAAVPSVLTVDGREEPSRAYSLVAASVVRNLGLHMMVLYRAAEEHDRVHLVASALGAGSLGPQLPRVLAGRPIRGKDHVDTLAREFVLRFTEGRASYVLDGELLGAREVQVSAGPVLEYVSP